MNITRLNFSKSLPYIKRIINNSDYVSIDLQMSGIVSDSQTNPSLVDTVQNHSNLSYKIVIQKRKDVSKNSYHYKQVYVVIKQMFNKISNSCQYVRITFYPFNFYIYPLSIRDADSVKFAFHSGSLNFLAKNQFDFNKLFYQHVPYISNQQLTNIKLKKQQLQLLKQLIRLDVVNSPATKAFLNLNLPLVQKWITQNTQAPLQLNVKYIKYKSYKTLVQEIQKQYASISFTFVFDHQQIFKRTKLIITKSKSQIQTNLFQNQQQQSNQFQLMNQVIDTIVSRKIPLIVHNGFLDLMHILNRFFQKLPTNWISFCSRLLSHFPYIYDTKFICNNYPTLYQTLQQETSLQNCYLKLKQNYNKNQQHSKNKNQYKIEIDKDFDQYKLQDQACHQAGFDALMTGYVFFRSMDMLKKPIENLKKKQFNQGSSLMRNRIPLGSIRIPLNLQQSSDIYSANSNKVLQLKSLLNRIHTQVEISDYFKQNYGAINLSWQDQLKTIFYITFVDQKQEQYFIQSNLDKDFIGVVSFLNDKFLVTSSQFMEIANPKQTLQTCKEK